MKKLRFLLFPLVLLLFLACGSDSQVRQEEAPSENALQAEETNSEEAEKNESSREETTLADQEVLPSSDSSTIKLVTYTGAAVYAAVTEYQFEDENGEMLLIRGPVFDEAAKFEIPDNMLDDDPNVEGPPGANPKLVGKTFELHYNAQGELVKMALQE